MRIDFVSILERIVYGPDGDDEPTRAVNVSSIPTAHTATPQQVAYEYPSTTEQRASVLQPSKSAPAETKELRLQRTNSSSWSPFRKPPRRTYEEKPTWRPDFFQPRPFWGLTGLCVTVGCVFASLAILVASDGQPVDSWSVEPTVYLAIVAAFANSAVRLARFSAIPISWWYKASRGGSIRALERHWEINNSVIRALFHSRSMSLLNIACIAGSFVIIDGPLLQRASTVVPGTQTMNVTLNLPLPAELPTGFSGHYYQHILWQTKQATEMDKEYLHNEAIHLNAHGCQGKCEAVIHGPGVVKQNCSSKTWPINPKILSDYNATWGSWKTYYENKGSSLARLPIYSTELSTAHGGGPEEVATLTVGLATWFDLNGEYVMTQCYLVPAILEYDIKIQDQIISIPLQPNQGRFVAFANNTRYELQSPAELEKKQPSTLSAITDLLEIFISANASAVLNENISPGVIYSPDPMTYNVNVFRHANLSNGNNDLNFIDPTPGIIFDYNRIMLRAAAEVQNLPHIKSLVDAGVATNQTVVARQTLQQNVFKSDLRWYAGAAVFELATVLLILPMFWGWWTIGCRMTLSPFALALAFDSPILKDVNSAVGARGVVRERGGMRLKFGEVVQDVPAVPHGEEPHSAATGRLGVAEAHNVVRPRKGMQFSK